MSEELAKVCHEIGCSGLSKRCPGDPCCSILRKIAVAATVTEETTDE